MLDLDDPQRLTIGGAQNIVFAVPGEMAKLRAEIDQIGRGFGG